MIKTKLLKHTINAKDYCTRRMQNMSAEVIYYTNLSKTAQNASLKSAYIQTAKIYLKRYEYYFNKQTSKQ